MPKAILIFIGYIEKIISLNCLRQILNHPLLKMFAKIFF